MGMWVVASLALKFKPITVVVSQRHARHYSVFDLITGSSGGTMRKRTRFTSTIT